MEKLAIVTDGGGMGCSYSAGVLCALAEIHNITEPDIVVGSSGSAGALAYYVSKQYASLKNVSSNLLTSKKFISFKRFYKVLDIDYLIDIISKKLDPLDHDKVVKAKTQLFLATTEYDTGQKNYFDNRQGVDMFEVMRASKAVPVCYGKKVKINNIDYIDGSISASLSTHIEKAIQEGAKNIIVVTDKKEKSRITNFFWTLYSFFVNRNLSKTVKKYVKNKLDLTQFKHINLVVISPMMYLHISALDNRKERLERVFNQGFTDAKESASLQVFLQRLLHTPSFEPQK